VKVDSRRAHQIQEVNRVLEVLPEESESLHCLQSGFFDLMSVVVALIGRLGACDHLRLATLAFSARNLQEMTRLLDSGQARRLTLLSSTFFRNYNRDLWTEAVTELRDRGQRAACWTTHAKVICWHFVSGAKLTLEGSANLRSNRSLEQFTLFNEPALHDWHAMWIDQLVSDHEKDTETESD
jgi:hypothetical protein